MKDSTYNNPWIYQGVPFESQDIGDAFGFVYLITDTRTGKKYIGRKYLYSVRKEKGKSRRVRKESDWKKYYSSSATLKQMVKKDGTSHFRREILSLHETKGKTNYAETKALFVNNVLESGVYLNDNILGRYFRGKV